MLKDSQAFSGFSVDDIQQAKQFYGETLGVKVQDGEMGLLELHLGGGLVVLVYPSGSHAPGSATLLNFPVDDIEAAVKDLTDRGVVFERYEGMDSAQDELGIFRGGGPLIAWFKDPAGNTLSVIAS
jgi:catechol 2,3-dioxygenase-like lactoylglutathione lyase family enzyme